MSDLTPSRIVIQAEEIAFNAAVAEDNLGRAGQSINHILTNHRWNFEWSINGAFGDQGATSKKDRPRHIEKRSELSAFIISLEQPDGVVTTVQLQKATGVGGSPTNMLSTAASFTASAANNALVGQRIREFEGDTQNLNFANCTSPTIDQANHTVDWGDVVWIEITSTDFSACNMSATAWFKTINQS